MVMPKFIKDGFLCFHTPAVDLKLKLEDGVQCRQAYIRMCKMDPAKWELSYTFKRDDPDTIIVTVSSEYGMLRLKTAPAHLLSHKLTFGFDVAREVINKLDYLDLLNRD